MVFLLLGAGSPSNLQLSSLPRSEASRGAGERVVNQITRALLNLDRRK
ncbi:MAG: hypothetical protein ACE15B_18335 [Bryobacteraceae bacterium]